MKLISFLLVVLITITSYSQDFNGDYRSYETSYKSEIDSTQNFVEKTDFKIFVSIDKDDGYIFCQDPRIPDKLLQYRITTEVINLQNNYIFKNTINDHLNDNTTSDIVFYYDTQNNLNLMISNTKASQVFKDLVKQE